MPPYRVSGPENRAPHGGLIGYSVRSPTCEDEGGNISAAEKIGMGKCGGSVQFNERRREKDNPENLPVRLIRKGR